MRYFIGTHLCQKSLYSDDAKSVPLYREYNPNAKTGTHNYTTKKSEHDFLVKNGWKNEGIGWYGCAN